MKIQKHLLSPGRYATDIGVFEATPADIRYWAGQGNKMLSTGLSIPVPLDHQKAVPVLREDRIAGRVRNNAGWTDGFFLDGDDLWANLDITDEEIAKKLSSIRYTSPQFRREYAVGDGSVWKNCITHVALCTVPRFQNQKPFGAKPKSVLPVLQASLSMGSVYDKNHCFSLSMSEFLGGSQALSDIIEGVGSSAAKMMLGRRYKISTSASSLLGRSKRHSRFTNSYGLANHQKP